LTQIVAEANDGEGGSYGELLMGALSVTIVAVLETLISAQIAKTRSKMPYDDVKELQGLALSHFACGICGLMPPTGVFVRTSVNLSTGATHKTSQFIQGLLVLVFAAVAMPLVSYIPQGGIAAILVMSCFRMVPWGYVQKLWNEQKWHFGLLCVVALLCWIVDSVSGLVVGTMVALLVTGKETARGHAEISITAAGNKQLADGSPEMISIDALAVDKVDLARRKVDEEDSESEEDSSEESELEAQLASTKPQYSHMAYAPEFDQFSRQESDQFGRQVSVTPDLFAREGKDRLTPTVRGDRVFLYKFLGQLDFLAGDRHVDRVQGVLKSGPKAVVLAMQNVPWVDPDGLEALRDIIAMLDDNHVQVYLACPRPKVTEALEKEAWYHEKTGSGQFVYSSEKSALMSAVGKSQDVGITANAHNMMLVGA
jgi:MFS superfamily sulfate permease-like transporter